MGRTTSSLFVCGFVEHIEEEAPDEVKQKHCLNSGAGGHHLLDGRRPQSITDHAGNEGKREPKWKAAGYVSPLLRAQPGGIDHVRSKGNHFCTVPLNF